jgi:hypothetical protein
MPYIGQSPATGEANSFKILDNISSYTLTFDGSGADVVSVDNDTITEREHRFVTGQRVTYNDGGGTAITGLSDGVYYIIVEDRHTFKLASSANNAAAGTAINLTGLGVGASHTLNVAFDGVNTKFKATHTNGNRADISQSAQLMVSINGVLQQPHDNTDSPPTGYATDHTSTIIFSSAPDIGDEFFGRLIAENFATFDISDNVVDNFTGDGSTSTFTLSKSPPNNESILVTIDGIVQYPDDNAAVRAYTVSENTLDFISAPGDGVEIQVRHIGFAGASTGGVSGFYGRTGNAALRSTDDIIFNNATASGTVQAANVTVTGDLTVNGTTTTLDTDLIGVDKLEVSANNTTVAAAITQTGTGDILNLYDGAAQVVTVTDGGNVGIGSESPVEKLVVAGDARITGILTVGSSSLTLDGTNDIVNVGTALTLSHTQGIQFYNQSLHSQGLDVNNINVTGIVTATTFSGAVTGTASDASGSTGDFSIADKIVHTGDTDTKIRFPAADTVTVETADVERLRITSGGAVQVNGGAVHLDASGELAVFETDTNLTFTNSSKLAFDFSGNVARIRTSFNGSASVRPLAFYTGNDERLRITSAGLVGIGTLSPSYRVDIGNGTSDPPNGYQLRINALGDYVFALQKASAASFSIRNNSTGVVHLNTQNSKRLALGVSSANNSGSIEEDVTIISSGNVGINQTSPNNAKLHVVGPGTGSDEIIAKFKGGSGGDCTSKIGIVAGYSDTANDTEGHVYIGALREGNGNQSSMIFQTDGQNTRMRIAADGSTYRGGTVITEFDMNWGHDTYQRPHIFSGRAGGNPSDAALVLASPETDPSSTRIGSLIFGCKTSSSSGVANSGLKAAIDCTTNTNVSDAWKTGGNLNFSIRPDNGNLSEALKINSFGDLYTRSIYSGNYGGGLFIGNNAVPTGNLCSLRDGNKRPIIYLGGSYPEINLVHDVVSNTSHGPTIRFASYVQSTNTPTGSQFVIGTNGTANRLDIGYAAAAQNANIHNGIDNYSGGTTALRIYNTGSVVTPAQPGFYARRSVAGDGRGAGAQEWVISGTASYNTGSHFNTSNGRFTAPVAGKYIFMTQPGYKQTSVDLQFYFRINNSNVNEPVRLIDGGDDLVSHSAVTGSAILNLAVNDYVDIYIGHTHHVNTTYNFFTGHLLG